MHIGLIGAGRAGLSIAALLNDQGHAIHLFDCRTNFFDSPLVQENRVCVYSELEEMLAKIEWLIVSVPDDYIYQVVNELPRDLAISGIVHLSGALGLEVFENLSPTIYRVALHPIRAFSSPIYDEKVLKTTYFGFTGDVGLYKLWQSLMPSVATKILRIDSDKRVKYHAAAVMASNFSVPMIQWSLLQYEALGINREDALSIIESLIRGVLDNFRREDSGNILTGPLVRGDIGTIEKHIDALEGKSRDYYKAMGLATLPFAETTLDTGCYQRLFKLLSSGQLDKRSSV